MDDGVIELPLTKDKVALISSDDYESVVNWSWQFDGRYARGAPYGRKEYLHRFIMKPKSGEVVDHINGNTLDCRRSNMRNCSRSLNSSNRNGPVKNKHGQRGVYSTPAGKYRAEVYYQGRHYALGTYSSPVTANAAYEEAKMKLQLGISII